MKNGIQRSFIHYEIGPYNLGKNKDEIIVCTNHYMSKNGVLYIKIPEKYSWFPVDPNQIFVIDIYNIKRLMWCNIELKGYHQWIKTTNLDELRWVAETVGIKIVYDREALKDIKGSCVQCGACCRSYDIILEYKDIRRWEKEGRKDILKKCNLYIDDVWLNPRTQVPYYRGCPWLKKDKVANKFYCKIHEIKPEICKNFPVGIGQLKNVRCKGYDWVSILGE